MIYPLEYPTNAKDYSNEAIYHARFKSELGKDYTVYYSLKLVTPDIPMREIDFVVVSDKMIICIELKNGKWRYKNSKWEFYNRRRKLWESYTDKPYSDPVDQVQSASKILMEFLNDHNSYQDPVPADYFQSAIFFLKNDAQDFAQHPKGSEFIFGKSSLKNSKTSLQSIIDIMESKSQNEIDSKTLHTIHEIIRLNLNFVLDITKKKFRQNSKLISLTKEQFDVIQKTKVTSKSLVIGVPGSGKTIVCIEQAKRMERLGKKTLFISGNLQSVSDEQNGFNWEFVHFVSYKDKNKLSKLLDGLENDFEFLIIDSSEKMVDPNLFEQMGSKLINHWEKGSWLVMAEYVNPDTNPDYYKNIHDLKSISDKTDYWNRNIRTPRKVYEQACLLGRKPFVSSRVPDITGIQYASFESPEEFYQKLEWAIHFGRRGLQIPLEDSILLCIEEEDVSDILGSADKFFTNRIQLTPYSELDESRNLDPSTQSQYEHQLTKEESSPQNVIRIATLKEFYGEEEGYVIITGIKDFNNPMYFDLYYHALTRCNQACTIIFPEMIKPQLVEILNSKKKKKVPTYKPDSV